MAKAGAKKSDRKEVVSLTHDEASRKNIPTAELQSVMKVEQQSPLRVAYDRRNRDLDPQLVWRGKDEQDWSDLVVHAPPLFIQEKVHPKVLIDDLVRCSKADAKASEPQIDLFGDFNGLPKGVDKTDFYEHEGHWSNRMILGDSLQVMASLAEREGLRGKVQCIYLDPPYGIKFNSNFQWSTTSRNVADGKLDQMTREPEQVKAFRDTWRDGIHTLLDLAERLPQEAAEALLVLATGGIPEKPVQIAAATDPFKHPDAQRRFRVMSNAGELERALEYPWEKWMVFLHPAQQSMIERQFNGPARIAGSAGTGKTIVALHRAVFLARKHPDAKVLLATFSETLAHALRSKVQILIGNEPKIHGRITVGTIDGLALQMYADAFGKPVIVDRDLIQKMINAESQKVAGHGYPIRFLLSEWDDVIDAWQLHDWDDYRDVSRLGRKTRLGERHRRVIWEILSPLREKLDEQKLMTMPSVFARITEHLKSDAAPVDFAVVDEVQDISVPQLRFVAAACGSKVNGLFFTGDQGQRIFQSPFSWKSLGVDIRGRSQTLRINYRTSHQIRRSADRLLGSTVSDVDGNEEERNRTISAFTGPEPVLAIADEKADEIELVGNWIKQQIADGLPPHEIGIFVRSQDQMGRAVSAVKAAGQNSVELDYRIASQADRISIATMHIAKGLEFRSVAVMACDDEVIPLQERVEAIADEADLEEVYNTERHLLYVACTRARDQLLVTAVAPGSEFLDDLRD